MDPVVADKCLTVHGIGDEDEFYRPFRQGEEKSGLFELYVSGNKPHVSHRDPDEGRHVVVAENCGRVPRCVIQDRESQDPKKGESHVSDEASAWRTALSISSGLYSGLAIHEPV
jgi:hypothetical protein